MIAGTAVFDRYADTCLSNIEEGTLYLADSPDWTMKRIIHRHGPDVDDQPGTPPLYDRAVREP